ncbi:hypothetical protein RhiirA5_360670 [Rhizophagus irregularis]|uniref:Uncharacterized protein n=4 Tax=Rhizophagus irregularis TaxID=588596 RepID=A0A2I1EV58_9GLOM|nr:hypothetical protein GLOIN_2v1505244 [Rhizophagus irregularis DAOM 181602=DAOM 197198]EXX63799.1 hypothetical protein RirG_148920 [Rhizophagus irregularis DAOM 197198w]PKC06049.1 hypothetical protein RhiirA5_360670 [Rhizophagus irregularis]PKC66322.1 hypothetical protein RhiirA1_419452 [Rhizophagus irregularis]PKY26014.1 hypothetical protein RhiirB3_414672 [Rhizophagus irregularis]POG81787.1 hypothetical protein GLOIN_2v1505244 [Rhizophagus irregularis DAOM 181602=DAOM 197198]|eukprot:XP_025188653.1 hypothetical protein GLOIN_2v1505244 [Rhizophagus irregularis DAOM 181602=DAOM 197198]
MKYHTLLFLVLLYLIAVSSAAPNGSKLLPRAFEKRNQCSCRFVVADFNHGSSRGIVTFAQDERGDTEVAGIFSKGFDDEHASYGLKIVDECRNVLFDLTDGLNITPDGSGGTKSFRHKFSEFSVDCDSNGILTKKIHNSKRTCHSNKIRKRLPNEAMTTQNGQGMDYTGIF